MHRLKKNEGHSNKASKLGLNDLCFIIDLLNPFQKAEQSEIYKALKFN